MNHWKKVINKNRYEILLRNVYLRIIVKMIVDGDINKV